MEEMIEYDVEQLRIDCQNTYDFVFRVRNTVKTLEMARLARKRRWLIFAKSMSDIEREWGRLPDTNTAKVLYHNFAYDLVDAVSEVLEKLEKLESESVEPIKAVLLPRSFGDMLFRRRLEYLKGSSPTLPKTTTIH